MKWVMWENVGVDRMACAWAIQKYIDKEAQFLFISEGQTLFPEDAEPLDIPEVRLSHHDGHCSFYTLLKEYNLEDPILFEIAQIVDEADTVQEAFLEPVAPGLDFICRGISLSSPDDQTALDRGYLIYEALYAKIASDRKSI